MEEVYVLTDNQLRVDLLLRLEHVYKEYQNTSLAAVNYRSDSISKKLYTVPHFRYIAEYRAGIFAKNERTFFEGEWDTPHGQLALDYEVCDSHSFYSGIIAFISFDSMVLRGAQDIRVAIVHGFLSNTDLVCFENNGYTVMSQEYGWAFHDDTQLNDIGYRPSAITRIY